MKTVLRRLGAYALALVMLLSMLATFTITASAATALNVSVTGLSVTWEYTETAGGSATWSASGNTITGAATGGTLKTNTSKVTMTNTSGSEATLKFSYTNSNGGTLTGLSGNAYEGVLAAGASISFTYKSPRLGKTATLSITDISLISTTAADPVLTFPVVEGGSYTVDGTAVTAATEKTVTAGANVALAATPASGYQFYAWYDETAGAYLSYNTSYTMIASADTTVYPVFRPSSMAMFGVGTAKYDNLTEAAAAAAAGSTKTVVLLNSGTITGNHTIPAGVKLLIPYDSANTEYGSSPECTSYSSIINNSGQIAWVKPTAYRTLTMAADATITVNGSIEVGGRHAAAGGTTGKYGGCPTGELGFIHMLAGSHIDLNSGANLYCWGYIYGDGTVTAKNGSSVYENFQMMEFRGGTVTTDLAADEKVFPSNQYYVQNIEVKTTYEYGATEYVATSVFMSNMCHGATVKFIGSDAMFQPSAGSYFTKTYDPATDRLLLEAYGNCTLGRMQMSMGGTDIDSAKFVLPITNNMSIFVRSGVATLGQSVMMLPGSALTIDEGATLEIAYSDATTPVVTAGGYALQLFDSENWTYGLDANMATVSNLNFVYQTGTSARFTPIEYSPSAYKKRTAADLTDVTLDINGTLVANGYLYSTVTWADAANGDYTIVSGGANIISSKGTGALAMNGGTGKDTLTCLYSQKTTPIGYYNIPLASAQLTNGDGTLFDTTGAAAGTVFRYCTVHGEWYANECGKCNAVEIMWVVNGVGETVEVEKYTTPVYPGATPTKSYNNNAHYVFAGWSVTDGGAVLETIPAATENATYYAVFTEAAHAYGATATDGKHYCTCGKPAGCYDAENDGDHLCDLGCGTEKSAHVGGTATCDKQAVCTECGQGYGNALGHTEVIDAAKDATCTETGLTEGKHCATCGTVLVAQEVVPALGHSEVIDAAKDATCTETGLTEGKHCATCGTVLVAQEVVPALGHSEVIDAAKDATCTETGLTEGKHCATCGTVLVAQEVVPALGHEEVIDAAKDATCTETGLTEGKHCATCGTVLVAQEVVPALGHTEVIDEAVAPTCTETGLTEGKHCATCGTVLVAQETVAALRHTDADHNLICDVCNEEFTIYTYTVTDGKATITDVNIALYGDVVIPDTIDGYPVVAIGNNAFRNCVNMTSVTIHEDIVTIGNYAFKDCTALTTVYYNAKNCTSAGVNVYPIFNGCTALTTAYIGKTVEATAPRLFRSATALTTVYLTKNTKTISTNTFHQCEALSTVYFVGTAGEWTEVAVKSNNTILNASSVLYVYNAPCFDEHEWTGECDSLCDLCGTRRSTTHGNIVDDAAVAPTCDTTGLTAGSHCEVCGNVIVKQNLIPALGHTWNAGEVLVEPTEEADGEKKYTCEVCGGEKIVPLNLGEVIDGYYYYKGVLKGGVGLVQVEDAYYYVTSSGAVKTGRYTLSGSDELGIAKGTYYFFADGKLNLAAGVYEGMYYNADGIAEAYAGLVEINGAKYYVGGAGGAVTTGRYFISKLNGLVPKKRAYTFYPDGRMLEETRIYDDGFYYENGIRIPYAGLVEYEGNYYYVGDSAAYIAGKRYLVSNLNSTGKTKGYYYFDTDGKMLYNVIRDNRYYGADGLAPYNAGVVEVDGNLYYNNGTYGALRVNATFTVTAEKTNGLCAAGKYTADANGVLTPAV